MTSMQLKSHAPAIRGPKRPGAPAAQPVTFGRLGELSGGRPGPRSPPVCGLERSRAAPASPVCRPRRQSRCAHASAAASQRPGGHASRMRRWRRCPSWRTAAAALRRALAAESTCHGRSARRAEPPPAVAQQAARRPVATAETPAARGRQAIALRSRHAVWQQGWLFRGCVRHAQLQPPPLRRGLPMRPQLARPPVAAPRPRRWRRCRRRGAG
jgi:hypothetical protein